MTTGQSLSSIPKRKKPSIPPSMDARLIKSHSKSPARHRRTLAIVNGQAKDDSEVYHRHRTSLKENMRSSLNAAWKEEDPVLFEWATHQQMQDNTRNRTSDRRKPLPSSGARRLLKVLSFNSKRKTSKATAEFNDPSPMNNTSTTRQGNNTAPLNHARDDDDVRRQTTESSTSFCPPPKSTIQSSDEPTATDEFLTVPQHLNNEQPDASSPPPNLQRSASARSAKEDYDDGPLSPALQRSRSARGVSGHSSTTTTSGLPLSQHHHQPPLTLRRSRSARIWPQQSGTTDDDDERTSSTLERARSARNLRRHNSLPLNDLFGSYYKSQSNTQLLVGHYNIRRGSSPCREIIFKDKEKGYISAFLGLDI